MPFPPYPDFLDKTALEAVERTSNVDTELSDELAQLKNDFGKLDGAAFEVPEITNKQRLDSFQIALQGEKTKIKRFCKSLAECNKKVFAKGQQLKKEKADPRTLKHVEKMVRAGIAFAQTLSDLGKEADELAEKARLAFGFTSGDNEDKGKSGAPKADKFLMQGLKALKSKPGLFALAIGSRGAYLVAGRRLPPELLKQAKTVSGGGRFLRGDCAWSQAKLAFVFVLPKKPPGGLAKKIRTAILDQTHKKVQDKVLVRGPIGAEIDADTDADTLGEVELEELTTRASEAFDKRMKALHPAYGKAMMANPALRAELDELAAKAKGRAEANDWATAEVLLDRYEVVIKHALLAAPKPAKAPKPDKPKGVSKKALRQSHQLWRTVRRTIKAELQAAEQKVLTYCKRVNADPKATTTYPIDDVVLKVKSLFNVLIDLDERLTDKIAEALNAETEEDRSTKNREAKAIIGEYEKFVNGNDILSALQASKIAQSNIGQTLKSVLTTMKSKM